MKCSQCGKGPVTANRISVTRSEVSRRSKRKQKPNVVKKRLVLDGIAQTVSICTKCLRTRVKRDRVQVAHPEERR